MQKHRRSMLQSKILLQLREKPVKPIARLARLIGASRPSVSRSIHTLKNQSLVARNREGWHLTDIGQAEVVIIVAEYVEMIKRFGSMAKRTAEAWSRLGENCLANISGILKLTGSLEPKFDSKVSIGISSSVLEGTSFCFDMPGILVNLWPTNVGSRQDSLFKTLDFSSLFLPENTALLAVQSTLVESLKPLLDVQKQYTGFLGSIIEASSFWEGVAIKNNILIANIIEDAFAIRQASLLQDFTKANIDFSQIVDNFVNTSKSYGNLFTEIISKAEFTQSFLISHSLEAIVVPTATVAHYTKSVRDLVSANDSFLEEEFPSKSNFEEIGDTGLDMMLSKSNSEFVEMRRSSWLALQTPEPDYLRHAGISQRELLSKLLEYLVPTDTLPEINIESPHLKALLKIILGMSDNEAEYVDNMYEAIVSQYDQLNKNTHHSKKNEAICRSILHAGEGLVRFILAHVTN